MSGFQAPNRFSYTDSEANGAEPPVDASVLERLRTIGGTRLLDGMIDIFLRDVPERVTAIRSALATGDLEVARRVAHALKSTAGNLGASELFELAGAIESVAGEDSERIRALSERLSAAFGAARDELSAYRTAGF